MELTSERESDTKQESDLRTSYSAANQEQKVEEPRRIKIHSAIIPEEGASWVFEEIGVYIKFSSKAVQYPRHVTCSLWRPIVVLPLLEDDERLVSNVIDMACNDPVGVNFEEITVALTHSASDLGGYELVIREFTDSENTGCRDLQATKGPPSEKSQWQSEIPFAMARITGFSHYAVICRLKSYHFSRNVMDNKFICNVPDYQNVTVEILRESLLLNGDFTLSMKVQEVSNYDFKKLRATHGLILHISSSPDIKLEKPATIRMPIALRQDHVKYRDLWSSHIRIYYRADSLQQWVEITKQLKAPAKLENGIVTFQVDHFCEFIGHDRSFKSILVRYADIQSSPSMNFFKQNSGYKQELATIPIVAALPRQSRQPVCGTTPLQDPPPNIDVALDNSRNSQIRTNTTTHLNVNQSTRRLPEAPAAEKGDTRRRTLERTFNYVSDFDEKGVIYYLGKIPWPGRGWENPAGDGKNRTKMTVKRSSDFSGYAEDLLEYFKPTPSCTSHDTKPWWGIDFGETYTLCLTTYTLRHGRTDGRCVLRNWKIEGKLEGPLESDDNWKLLKKHKKETWSLQSIAPAYVTKSWNIQSVSKPFRYFRIVQLDKKRPIYLAGMELYGQLTAK